MGAKKLVVFKPNSETKKINLPFPELKNNLSRKDVKLSVSTTTRTTIYQVPKGKIFVLLSAFLTYSATNASGGGDSYIEFGSSGNYLLAQTCPNPAAGQVFTGSLALNFEGLRFCENESLVADNGSAIRVLAGITGYEIESGALDGNYRI